jgi:hypothetical protein
VSFKDIQGQRFGMLTVVKRMHSIKGTVMWQCVCDCGEQRVVEGTGLRAGRNKSCGCNSPRFKSTKFPDHPLKNTRTYRIWIHMQYRCDPNARLSGKSKKYYIDKGITVCERWVESFDNFIADMGKAPDGLSIDRIDGSKGYCPENCRWANPKEQANNTDRNIYIELFGRIKTMAEWADMTPIKRNTIQYRLRRGWSTEDALTRPVQKRSR